MLFKMKRAPRKSPSIITSNLENASRYCMKCFNLTDSDGARQNALDELKKVDNTLIRSVLTDGCHLCGAFGYDVPYITDTIRKNRRKGEDGFYPIIF